MENPRLPRTRNGSRPSPRRDGKLRIPLGVIILAFLFVTVTTVGVLSWYLTLTSSQDSLQKISQTVAEKVQKAVEIEMRLRLDAIEKAVVTHKGLWERKLVSLADKNGALLQVHPLFNGFQEFIATASFTTKFGELWGWATNVDPDTGGRTYIKWEHELPNFSESIVNERGEYVNFFPDGTPRPETTSQSNFQNGEWFVKLDLLDPTSQLWTSPYMWYNRAWVTHSRPAFQDGEMQVVVSGDMEVSFLSNILKKITVGRDDKLPLKIFVLSAADGSLLGSSISDVQLFKVNDADGTNERPLVFSESPNVFLQGLQTLLHNSTVQDWYRSIGPGVFRTESVNVNATEYFVSTSSFKHGTIEWMMVQYLGQDAIMGEVKQRGLFTAVIAAAITIGALLLALAFVLVITKQLANLYDDIHSLANFRFHKVANVHRGSSSWIRELFRIQMAFQHLVQTYADTIERRNRMLGRPQDDTPTPLSDQPDVFRSADMDFAP